MWFVLLLACASKAPTPVAAPESAPDPSVFTARCGGVALQGRINTQVSPADAFRLLDCRVTEHEVAIDLRLSDIGTLRLRPAPDAAWPALVKVRAEAWLLEGFETSHGRLERSTVPCDWGRLDSCSVASVTLESLTDVPQVSMDFVDAYRR